MTRVSWPTSSLPLHNDECYLNVIHIGVSQVTYSSCHPLIGGPVWHLTLQSGCWMSVCGLLIDCFACDKCVNSLTAGSMEGAKEDGSGIRIVASGSRLRGNPFCHQCGVLPAADVSLCHHHFQVRGQWGTSNQSERSQMFQLVHCTTDHSPLTSDLISP